MVIADKTDKRKLDLREMNLFWRRIREVCAVTDNVVQIALSLRHLADDLNILSRSYQKVL